MRGLLPSVWLLGAALYTGSVLSLIDPFSGEERWPAPPPVTETVVAKRSLAVPGQAASHGETAPVHAAVAVKTKLEHHNEWVHVVGYTTMVRSRPSAGAPPLYAYAVGRPLRVIAREGGYARVQDLGSGKLGWIEEVSLAPFFGGYRQREPRITEPVIAAVAPPPATVAAAESPSSPIAETPVTVTKLRSAVVASKKPRKPRNEAIAARPDGATVASAETGSGRGLFRKKRGMQRVALREGGSSFAGMIERAIRGF